MLFGMRKLLFTGCWLSVLAVIGVQTPVEAQQRDMTPSTKAVMAQAKREAAVVHFTGSGRYPGGDKIFERAYQRWAGFGINITFAALGPHPTVVARIIQEAKSGVPSGLDVFISGGGQQARLLKAGLLEPVKWDQLGVKKGFYAPELHGVWIRDSYRHVIYNTKLVSKADAPRKWQDLLDPKWKGRIIGPAFGSYFPYVALAIGEEEAKSLARALKEKQNLAFAASYTDVRNRVATGEYPIGIGITGGIDKKKGAPVENAPLEKTGGFAWYATVMKDARHPGAAKAYILFLNSDEGQKVLDEVMQFSRHTTEGTESWEIAQGGRAVFSSVEWELKEYRRLTKVFTKILGFQR